MFKFLYLPMILLFSLSAIAAPNLAGFEKRFKLVKNEAGELTYVKMNFFSKKFSIKPYLEQIKSDLKSEIERMRSKSYDGELDEFMLSLGEGQEKSAEAQENIFELETLLRI